MKQYIIAGLAALIILVGGVIFVVLGIAGRNEEVMETVVGQEIPAAKLRSAGIAEENTEENTQENIGEEEEAEPEEAEAEPVEAGPLEYASEVAFERITGSGEEYAVITGLSSQGEEVWSYTTGKYTMAQLDSVNDVGTYNENYYFVEDGTVHVIRVADGSTVWTNSEFGGSAYAGVVDGGGTLYLCGYFGPDLFIADAEGRTIKKIGVLDKEYFWPYQIDYQETRVAITFEGTPSGESEVLYVNLSDYSLSYEKEKPAAEEGQTQIPQVTMSAVSGASATSYLVETKYNLSHGPENVIDGTLSNAWVENASGQGEGEAVTLELDGTYMVSGFTINAGYQKNADLYKKNSRPASLRVTFSDGTSQDVSLEDYYGEQTLTFDPAVATSSVTFTIQSVYAGNKYQDTVISEISLF